MSNELILILNLFFIYGSVFVSFKLFGKKGLFCFAVLAAIAANIEVLILVNAFGMEQTLGNILFGSTFLVTDILSELYGKKEARDAVNISIFISIIFIIITQSWFLYVPSPQDFVMESIHNVFSNTPRVMISGLLVYGIVQRFDVWLYHKIWQITKEKSGSEKRFLWLRNNGSTLVSQLLNSVLFTLAAFLGTYDAATLIAIILSSYIIFIITSLADTPIIYLARLYFKKEVKI